MFILNEVLRGYFNMLYRYMVLYKGVIAQGFYLLLYSIALRNFSLSSDKID